MRKKDFMKNIEKTHIILWCTLTFFIIALLWANFAVLDEVTTAEGKIIPTSNVQIIQHLEGGIIKKVAVHEGETVEKGQVLVELNNTRFSGEFRQNQLKHLELQVKIDRLNAEIQKKTFKPNPEIKKRLPKLAVTEKRLYASRKRELKTLVTQRNLLAQEIKMTRPLVGEGAVSKVELLRLQQKLNEMNGKIHNIDSRALDELHETRAELTQVKEKEATFKDRLERTMIRSPVRGIVKEIHVHTVGAVIKPGMAMIEIVPLEDTLRVEARVRPGDIGFIHADQKAIVKITAYDYAIYGGLEGHVEYISADTSKDEDGNSYYEIRVRTNKAYLGTSKHPLAIIPGMQASVDILTGKKTVLQYLLKPILRAKNRALRER